MATVSHAKTNAIADWTQAELDAAIAEGFYPPGTVLNDIVLPSDWNNAHTITGLDIGSDVQAWSANLDEYAAVNPTAAGLALLDDADNTAQRSTLGLGNSATLNTGTAAGTVATGDHNHTGVYEPADATILKDADIGSTVQAYDADTAKTDAANSWTLQQTFKETADTVYTITDGADFEIDPANGNVQKITLGANRTPAATNFASGQAVVLKVADGTAYTITWTTVGVVWVGGITPTLATSGYTVIVLWKDADAIYGKHVGNVA